MANKKKKKQPIPAGVIDQAYELVPIDSIQPHPRNVNEGDQGAIIESIERNGFIGAAIVQRSTGNIVAGKHRWLAAKQSGINEFPVIFADIDDETALRYMLADNRTARLGLDNPEALVATEPHLFWNGNRAEILRGNSRTYGCNGSYRGIGS